MRRIRSRYRGVAAMLAMLYLVLFSTLAIGFYAAVTTATQVSYNDDRIARAQIAAESGMAFMRYQLARVSIPAATPTTGVTLALFNDLAQQMVATGNLSGMSIGGYDNVIQIPSDPTQTKYIKLDTLGANSSANAGFRVTITDWPDQGKVVVKVVGHYLNMTRAIQLDFSRVPKESSIFDNAVASRGQIRVEKGEINSTDPNNSSIAKILSAQNDLGAITVTGGIVGGDITILDTATANVTGGSVGGSSIPSVILNQHVHTVDVAPEFPTFDPTAYAKYATAPWVAGKNVQRNVYIPRGLGTPSNPIQLNANDTIQGILYIQSPNCVKFNGDFKLQGFIVFETSASTTDYLDFRGNVTQAPLPSSSEFDRLRAASGVCILAPNADITMSGSTDSLLKGNIVCDTFEFQGSADIVVDNGTLITYNEGDDSAVFSGKTVKFTATGTNNLPKTGMSFSETYRADPNSYAELMP